ncbi:MAG: metallophosphoesterase [Pseudomonadales bacterium]|nr:metallophosphoesterase [Pseudomonadales bacterium]MCP5182515.1 metallophosphoesterase [Pseudomonadales bacterium]
MNTHDPTGSSPLQALAEAGVAVGTHPPQVPGQLPLLDTEATHAALEKRMGRIHASVRLGMERDHAAQAFGQGMNFLHLENMPPVAIAIELLLRLTGTWRRGLANAARVELTRNTLTLAHLPTAFDGYRVLHLSDLHVDMCAPAMATVGKLVSDLHYDLCVLTGDYRGRTWGDTGQCLEGMQRLRKALRGTVYAVLGNHDSITMVPDLEAMGFHVLLNESVKLTRDGAAIHLAGVDDAHFFRADNLENAAAGIPREAVAILLSHTPEIYRQAAHAGFDIMLSGHTHGGQICLPGGVPIILESRMPRRFGAGPWRYGTLEGYTSRGAGSSVVPVRFNNQPEITLHQLVRRVP